MGAWEAALSNLPCMALSCGFWEAHPKSKKARGYNLHTQKKRETEGSPQARKEHTDTIFLLVYFLFG